MLARRPLSVQELRQRLEAKGYPPRDVDEACSRLRESGYLDDRRLALDYIVTRSERLGHGPGRLVGDLIRRGVRTEVARSAMRLAVEQGDVVPRELLRDRLRRALGRDQRPLDRSTHARVYNALRRAGFDEDSIRQELQPYHEEDDDLR
jgi:regulatory protein